MNALDARLVVRRDSFTLDVGLHLPPGTTVALVGPNGAGKSTVVAALAGLLRPDEGHIRVGEQTLLDVAAGVDVPPSRRRIGVVFQDGLLFDHLTVAENVAFGAVNDEAATGWLERFDLAGLADRQPASLSGGQAQRVAMARALAADPAVLLLDEPFASLDATARPAMRRVVGEHLAGFPGPRLLITHDPTDAFALADEVRVLEAGAITQVGTPDDIRRHPTTRYAADLVGVNLLRGRGVGGRVEVGGFALAVPEPPDGPVLVVVHPRAVGLHAERPSGSARNVWRATVAHAETLGERVRIELGGPLELVAEVTPAGADALPADGEVWASVKATEVEILPA